jgi:hypothetical protein
MVTENAVQGHTTIDEEDAVVAMNLQSSMVYVTKLDSNGLPSEPPEARKAFKRASKFQVRDNVPITNTN